MVASVALHRFLRRARETKNDITPERVGGLIAMAREPFRYTQRCVEQLSFVPTGGQRWVRTLQIQVPDNSGPSTPSLWTIPLGQFERKRLVDLFVTDATGTRLNLLTRTQHGEALMEAITAKYSSALTNEQREKLKAGEARKQHKELRELLFQYFTTLNTPASNNDDDKLAKPLAAKYDSVLEAIQLDQKSRQDLVEIFYKEFERNEGTTQYLCWVQAAQGEVINLRVTYTANDPKHKLRIETLGKALQAILFGIFRPRRGRKVRDNWYRQYGITPIGYRSGFPRGEGASSYYLTLEPPAETICTLLDWESGSSFDENQEVNSAFPALHIHNEGTQDKTNGPIAPKEIGKLKVRETGGELRAYLRCAPYRHKQILAAAALNFAVVWLLFKRQLPVGLDGTLQELILAAPSVIVAFLAQRQSHYHAHVTRRQRAILWTYLAISVTFVVSIAFDGQTKDHQLSDWTDFFAWAVAISSAGIFGWHLLLGGSYERVVQYLTDRKWEVEHPAKELKRMRKKANSVRSKYWKWKEIEAKTKWECFAFAVRQYAVTTWVLSLALIAGATISLFHFGHFPLKLALKEEASVVNQISTNKHAGDASEAPAKSFSLPPSPSPTHPTPTGNHPESRGP